MTPQFFTVLMKEYLEQLKKYKLSIFFRFEIYIDGYAIKWPEDKNTLKGLQITSIPLIWEGEKIGTYFWKGSLNEAQSSIHDLLRENLLFKLNQKLTRNQFTCSIGVLNSAIKAIEVKDHYTGGHSDRVASLAMEIALQMKVDLSEFDIEFAAKLHDIGKIGISENVLTKPASLEAKEIFEIRKHPEIGAQILAPLSFFAHLVPIIRHHHERYDGTGYPDMLKGDNIPLLSRIISVADTFDALTSDRPYRKALAVEEARGIIKQERGAQFDPMVVEAFLKLPQYLLTNLRAS